MRIGTHPRLPMARLASLAARDHAAARGTRHLELVRDALKELAEELERLRARHGALREKLDILDREFEAALRREVILRELRRLPGIGPALAREIVATCYDGALEGLEAAGERVPGIGERRGEAIRRWVREMGPRLPSLLEEDSPERKRLAADFDARRARLERRLARLEKEIAALEDLRRRATAGIRWLEEVTPRHFIRAYQGDAVARELVERYLLGIFPEWDEPPGWFAELMERFS